MTRFITVDRQTKETAGQVVFADTYEIIPEFDFRTGHRWGHFRREGTVICSVDATRWQVIDSGYGIAVPDDEGDLAAIGKPYVAPCRSGDAPAW